MTSTIMRQIRLSFIALKDQSFVFTVYRQPYSGQQEKEGYYRKPLPKVLGDENYVDYWNTFKKMDGFEPFKCEAYTNPFLTLKLLQNCLRLSIEQNLSQNEYIIETRRINRPQVLIILLKHDEGVELIELEPYYLKQERKLGFLLDYRFKVLKDDISEYDRKRIMQHSLVLDRKMPNRRNKNYYSDKYDKIHDFFVGFKNRIFPLSHESELYDVSQDLLPLKRHSLKTKTYLFHEEAEDKSQFNGLLKNGPLKGLGKSPLLIFIFKADQREYANDIYKALIGKTHRTFPGMQKMFRLNISVADFQKVEIESYSKEQICAVEDKLVQLKAEHENRSIIVVFLEHYKKYSDSNFVYSPYYLLKLICTKNQIPLQAVTVEHLRSYDGLKWSASNIALAIFSKLGGYPWKVKPRNENCLIIGIGQAHSIDKETKKITKYFAYSVCLDSSGLYKKLAILGEGEDEQAYLNTLKTNIAELIQSLVKQECISKCVVHLPFKIRKNEIERIQDSINDIQSSSDDTRFQVIKINTKNKYFGYAENNSRIPYESDYIKLSTSEYLLWFEGLQYHTETVFKQFGNPVHIEFLGPQSLGEDERVSYLQDIINLSGANWRGFRAKASPISIYYPKLIASYISEFRKFDESYDISVENLQTPWFL